MKVKIRGISYHFEIHQEKQELPNLVLLHGFMGSGKSFQHLIPDLKTFCNPITIDLLGHGETEGSEMHYRFSAKEQIADVNKLISEQLHLPLFLLGYSMGGRLALHLALHRPDLYKGLILESTTFGIESKQERQARQELDATRADSIMGNFEQFLQSWKNMPMFSSSAQNIEIETQHFEIQREQNPLWMNNSLLGFGTGTMPCVKDKLASIPTHVQLLAGAKDFKFVGIMNAMLKDLNDAKLDVIKDSGHRVHLDQPEAYISIIRDFIEKNRLP